jgi:hypothetical protein
MSRWIGMALIIVGLASACTQMPQTHLAGTRYCEISSHEPCLDNRPTGNCVPCIG